MSIKTDLTFPHFQTLHQATTAIRGDEIEVRPACVLILESASSPLLVNVIDARLCNDPLPKTRQTFLAD